VDQAEDEADSPTVSVGLENALVWAVLHRLGCGAQQVEQARITVDFFVCLLYGRLLVAIAALIQRCWAVAIVLVVLAFWPYERATKSTDDWAAATRALL